MTSPRERLPKSSAGQYAESIGIPPILVNYLKIVKIWHLFGTGASGRNARVA